MFDSGPIWPRERIPAHLEWTLDMGDSWWVRCALGSSGVGIQRLPRALKIYGCVTVGARSLGGSGYGHAIVEGLGLRRSIKLPRPVCCTRTLRHGLAAHRGRLGAPSNQWRRWAHLPEGLKSLRGQGKEAPLFR